MLNGKRMELTVPVVFKGKTAFLSKDFINQVFSPAWTATFVVETHFPPQPPECGRNHRGGGHRQAIGTLQAGFRFTEVSVKAPPKDQVWNFIYTGQNVTQPRQAMSCWTAST